MPTQLLRPGRDESLLSPNSYDDDTSSIHSAERSDQDTDSEDDEVLMAARTSAEIRQHDRTVLLEEEENDRLLEANRQRGRRGSALAMVQPLKNLFAKSYTDLSSPGSTSEMAEKGQGRRGRRQRRRARRTEKKERLLADAKNGEDGELMYELEEGGIREGSSTGESSETDGSELDRQGLQRLQDGKSRRKSSWRMWSFIHSLIAVGFSILVLIAWKLSLHQKSRIPIQPMLNNRTALFAPTTILISLDGFRADFLKRGITPRINSFIADGVSPLYMNPSFPSVTFPNHYTLVTGLYPESHGIVGNTFWDDELKDEFFYTRPQAMQPKWWGGEPLWVTAEAQGIRTAIHMWPGSEAHIMEVEPAFLDKYNGKEPLPNKVKRILELLDKPGLEDMTTETVDMRPQLIAAYVPNIDADGHLYGPNSTEIRVTINDVDTMLGHLFEGLEARNLTNIVNVVIVSDHGMATTDTSRLIQLEDIIDTNLVERTDGWPLFGIRPKDMSHLQDLYDKLVAEAAVNPNFDVYLRDQNMPERYHFSKNQRIAPLWIIPKTGWAIVTKKEFDVVDAISKGIQYHPRGLHGYDHEHPLMRAIFIARGPAFPHAGNSRVQPFQNIEVYNIICDSLNLVPKPNNGTIRLPFQPVGLHSPESILEVPVDPIPAPSPSTSPRPSVTSSPSPVSTSGEEPDMIHISPIEASSAADPNVVPPPVVGITPPEDASVERPVVEDEGNKSDDGVDFLSWFKHKIEKVKGWIGDLVGTKKKGGT